MKKIILFLVCAIFSLSAIAQEKECLRHIEDHISQPDTLNLVICNFQDSDMNNLSVELSKVLKDHPNIRILDLRYNNITDKGLQILTQQDQITQILIGQNHIGDNGIKEIIQKFKNLDTLDVDNNGITNLSVPLLASSKIINISLLGNQITNASPLAIKTKLCLSGNLLSTDTLLKLAHSTTLKSLDIPWANLDESILKALRDNQNIEILGIQQAKMGDHLIGDKGIQILAGNNHIETLWVYGDGISDEGIKRGIAKMPKLRCLGLGWNNISYEGAAALPKNLITLYLMHNQLGDKGAQTIEGEQLKNLDLSYNQIQEKETAHYLVNKLPLLTDLSINNNSLGAGGAKELGKRDFHSLQIDSNKIGNEGAEALASHVTYDLSMYSNEIDDRGILKLEPFLNIGLYYLDVQGNHIGAKGIQALIK